MSTWKTVRSRWSSAVALGDRAGELVLGDDALLEQHALRRRARARAASTAVVDALARREPSSTMHVGEEAAQATALASADVTPFQSSLRGLPGECALADGCRVGAFARMRAPAGPLVRCAAARGSLRARGVVRAARRARAASLRRVGVHRAPDSGGSAVRRIALREAGRRSPPRRPPATLAGSTAARHGRRAPASRLALPRAAARDDVERGRPPGPALEAARALARRGSRGRRPPATPACARGERRGGRRDAVDEVDDACGIR